MLLDQGWEQLDCKLNPAVVRALHEMSFTKMMPVQKAAIPLMLQNYDLAVEAQTGSGKSLAFVIPILQRLLKLQPDPAKTHKPLFLILSPTRELCQQTHSLLLNLLQKMASPYAELVICATGGRPLQEDLQRCEQSVLVLIGTVGRVREIITYSQELQRYLRQVDYLYIDEGDRVLQEKGIQTVVAAVPKMRRTAIFSATLQAITQNDLKLYGMRNLAKISLKATQLRPAKKKQQSSTPTITSKSNPQNSYSVPSSLINEYIVLPNRSQKIYYLMNFLSVHGLNTKIIVFLSTCACVEFYAKLFAHLTFFKMLKIEGIHGQLKPKKRNKIITSFMEAEKGSVLFATDVVSRGIDFGDVEYIMQLDPPDDPDNFIHRIGRTARVNRVGNALLFLQPHQLDFIAYLKNKNAPITPHTPLADPPLASCDLHQSCMNLILTDRDYLQKAKRAFVSFVRSYKQHDLKYIFEFKNLELGDVANSFFLLRLPRIKEILGRTVKNFVQSEIDPETIPWKDSNQRKQFQQRRQERRNQEGLDQRDKKPAIDIKNKKSMRKKLKRKLKDEEMDQFRREEKEIRKERGWGTASKKGQKKYQEEVDDDLSVATEELEERITKKAKREA